MDAAAAPHPEKIRTRVAIVGAGPAGLILSHLLADAGIESIVIDQRSRDEIEHTIRAGILEQGTVDLLTAIDPNTRVNTVGDRHDGIELRFQGEGHRIDFPGLVGRSVWLYPQHEVLKDMLALRLGAGQDLRFGVTATRVEDIDSERPRVLTTTAAGEELTIEADFVVGADGSRSVVRPAITGDSRSGFFREYPFAWFGILTEAPPSAEELIYSNSPNGFARAQQGSIRAALQNGGELPAEVERVLHRHVHALPGLGAVSVAGVAREEQVRCGIRRGLRRQIIEAIRDPLTDLVDARPGDLLHIDRVGVQNRVRDVCELGGRRLADLRVAGLHHTEVYVAAHHVAALTRDHQQAALAGGLHDVLGAPVGEVGRGEHVHDAPGVVGRIALQADAESATHVAARAVAADHVLGADGELLALGPPQGRDDRMLRCGVHLVADELHAVICFEPARGLRRVIEQELLHARLVHDHVRELAQPRRSVVDPAAARDLGAVVFGRAPEPHLVDPVGLTDERVGETERLEHLDRAARDAIGLSDLERARPTLDDARRDVGERRELRGEHGAGGPGADDEHIDSVGEPGSAVRRLRRRRPDVGVTGAVSVAIELHGISFDHSGRDDTADSNSLGSQR